MKEDKVCEMRYVLHASHEMRYVLPIVCSSSSILRTAGLHSGSLVQVLPQHRNTATVFVFK